MASSIFIAGRIIELIKQEISVTVNDSKARQAARAFFQHKQYDVSKIIESEIGKELYKIDSFQSNYSEKKNDLYEIGQEVERAKTEYGELKESIEILKNSYNNPKIVDAIRLYQQISKPQPGDDSYLKQKRIVAAYVMASATLGMQSLNFGGQNTPNINSLISKGKNDD